MQTHLLVFIGNQAVTIIINDVTFYNSTSQMAQDVIDLLDHFGWNKNVHLDGVSMGGMIALELVSTWPQRFSSLVLTSTRSGRQLPPVRN